MTISWRPERVCRRGTAPRALGDLQRVLISGCWRPGIAIRTAPQRHTPAARVKGGGKTYQWGVIGDNYRIGRTTNWHGLLSAVTLGAVPQAGVRGWDSIDDPGLGVAVHARGGDVPTQGEVLDTEQAGHHVDDPFSEQWQPRDAPGQDRKFHPGVPDSYWLWTPSSEAPASGPMMT